MILRAEDRYDVNLSGQPTVAAFGGPGSKKKGLDIESMYSEL